MPLGKLSFLFDTVLQPMVNGVGGLSPKTRAPPTFPVHTVSLAETHITSA